MMEKRKIGVHTSIAGGLCRSLERTKELGCNTMQIFSHSPRLWAAKERTSDEIAAFRKLRQEYAISPIFIHTSYLINLATADPGLKKKSTDMIIREMTAADEIGAEYVVLHTGSASHDNPKTARKRAISCLIGISQEKNWNASLLLENTAGERGDTTSKIEDICEIVDNVPGNLLAGLCIDTCHAFAAGYDIGSSRGLTQLAADIERYTGKNRLRLLHLNDSKGALGSGVDRHEHIGEGRIGIDGLKLLLNHPYFINIPMILETPKRTDDDDPRNLKTVRNLIKSTRSEVVHKPT